MKQARGPAPKQRHPHKQRPRKGGGGGQPSYQPPAPPPVPVAPGETVTGILHQLSEQRDGSLRDPANLLRPLPQQIIVPRAFMGENGLRPGVKVTLSVNGRHARKVESIEDEDPATFARRAHLYEATAVDPGPQLKLEHDPAELTTRAIDLLTPVGFGQRGLIVASPRVGKTILLQNIAKGIGKNHPDVELVLLLVDERPEEVTDMRRNVPGTVFASSNDNRTEQHTDLAQLVIERCKRRVELGKNVVVLMDSLTRLGRAFNADARSGKTLSGGVDSRALEVPKKLFGAARRLEEGGSLTILATCLIDTGSRADQLIFEEFKGTGNMELMLDRQLADKRIFPAINITQSGTRKEELLLDPLVLEGNRKLRRHLVGMHPAQGMQSLLDALKRVPTNDVLYKSMALSR